MPVRLKQVRIEEITSAIVKLLPTKTIHDLRNRMGQIFVKGFRDKYHILVKELQQRGESYTITDFERDNGWVGVTNEAGVWSDRYIKSLPDTCFCFVSKGVKKYPYRNREGLISIPRLRKALIELSKDDMPDIDRSVAFEHLKQAAIFSGVTYKSVEISKSEEDERLSKINKSEIEPHDFEPAAWLTNTNQARCNICGIVKEDHDALNDSQVYTVVKSDEDEHYVLGIVYEPDKKDAHGDFARAAQIRNAAHNYMAEHQQIRLMHEQPVMVPILESYIAPIDMKIEERDIKKGTWLMAVRVEQPWIWKDVKSGKLGYFSMGGYANKRPNTEI